MVNLFYDILDIGCPRISSVINIVCTFFCYIIEPDALINLFLNENAYIDDNWQNTRCFKLQKNMTTSHWYNATVNFSDNTKN